MTGSSTHASSNAAAKPPVFVHIGEAKTGTTFLQNLFDDNRDALRADGLLYPSGGGSGHPKAALALRHAKFKGVEDPLQAGAWLRLVDEIREWNGRSLISSELLAPARPAHIERLHRTLDFAEIHIILTVRDLARQIPAQWQERIKNRGVESYADYLASIQQADPEPDTPGFNFWRLHDVEGILERWSVGIPPGRIHVITLPPPGGDSTLLWRRFADVIGVDPGRYRLPDKNVNTSLGAAEVSVVRRVNVALGGDAFPWPAYDRLMKWYFSPELARRTGLPIDLPEAEYEWAMARTEQTAKAIAAGGYDIVGDLAELTATPRPTGVDPDAVGDDLQADAAISGIASLVQLLAEGGDKPEEDAPPRDLIKRCLVQLSEQVRWLGAARRGYSKLRRRRTK